VNRKAFIAKYGRDAWDAMQWVKRYERIGEKRDGGLSGPWVTSKKSAKIYKGLMKKVSVEMRIHYKSTLEQMTPEQFREVLQRFSGELTQGSLDNMRVAGQKGFGQMAKHSDQKFDRVKSTVDQILKARAYSNEAIKVIHNNGLSEKHKLSVEVIAVGGPRTADLFTLRRIEEQPRSERDQVELYPDKLGWVPYTVHGKGGMIYTVMLPKELSDRVEATRIDPREYKDRGIKSDPRYPQVYNLVCGQALSTAFTRASHKTLGFSNGIHGLRHSYAQRRMHELAKLGHDRDQALLVVSQEMGHIRPEITEVYLR